MATDNALAGKHILVTRPQGLQHELCRLLREVGANPVHYAAIEIVPPSDEQSREHARAHFDDFDIAIFISPTAVNTTLQYMPIENGHCQLAAIGSRSQRALEQAGLVVQIQPHGHDSESLLQHAALQASIVHGKHIVIFRGEDGRDVLGDTLRQRGADVHYAAMYRRICPQHVQVLDDAFLQGIHVITISSNEGLQNLYDMARAAASDMAQLTRIALCVPGQRAAKLARELGFGKIIVAENATDAAMFAAVGSVFATSESN